MPFTIAVLAAAVLVAYLRGGRMQALAHTQLVGAWLLFAGLGLQVMVDLAVGRAWLPDAGVPGWSLLLVSQGLVVLFLVRNRRLPGVWWVAAGLLLNAVVMAANRAMPVDPAAIAALGVEDATLQAGKHTLMTDQTWLPWLADVIPVPWLRSIISVGDLVLAVGLFPMTHALMTADPPGDEERAGTTRGSA